MTDRKSPTREEIEQRAYALFLERGGENGHALEDWLAAESELTEAPQPAEVPQLAEPSERSTSAPPKTRAASASQRPTPAAKGGSTREASLK
jgi:hypothetical protein